MVDTTDTPRLEQAGQELRGVVETLQEMEPPHRKIPIAVLGNKASRKIKIKAAMYEDGWKINYF